MVDRLVHHSEVLVLEGKSYRLNGKAQEVLVAEQTR
jgi:DNA replication protein DnaC